MSYCCFQARLSVYSTQNTTRCCGRQRFEGYILEAYCSHSNMGQLIVATDNGMVWQCSPPRDVSEKQWQVDTPSAVAIPRLQTALSLCLSGESSPAHYCDSLISYAACRESFAEWCSAHQILALAVQNGDIPRSTKHKGNIAHWFETLYCILL